jgi:hypothetical protein
VTVTIAGACDLEWLSWLPGVAVNEAQCRVNERADLDEELDDDEDDEDLDDEDDGEEDDDHSWEEVGEDDDNEADDDEDDDSQVEPE